MENRSSRCFSSLTDKDRRHLEKTFIRVYSRLRAEENPGSPAAGSVPPLTLQFYPYTTLKHTIRGRGGRVLVRISDILRDAPVEVLEALLTILIHRLLGQPFPSVCRQVYRSFIRESAVRREILRVRRMRGRKRLGPAQGQVFDLGQVFKALNRRYFRNRVNIRCLGWSLSPNRRTLGHYDPAHQTIAINRRLDHPLVPSYVVEYVLYHEMLHAMMGSVSRGGRRHFHDRRFRDAERRFADYERARRFIESEF